MTLQGLLLYLDIFLLAMPIAFRGQLLEIARKVIYESNTVNELNFLVAVRMAGAIGSILYLVILAWFTTEIFNNVAHKEELVQKAFAIFILFMIEQHFVSKPLKKILNTRR